VSEAGGEVSARLVAIVHEFQTCGEAEIKALDHQAFLDALNRLDFFFKEIRSLAASEWRREVAEGARHGDWETLAAYIEGGGEITEEMRPTIVACLRGEPRIGNPPKTRTEIESYARALFVIQHEQEGMKLARAKEAAQEWFGVSDTTLKKDMKANEGGLRKLKKFYSVVRKYVGLLVSHGVRHGWADRDFAEWQINRVIAVLTDVPAELQAARRGGARGSNKIRSV
jgi:hypothetical protein